MATEAVTGTGQANRPRVGEAGGAEAGASGWAGPSGGWNPVVRLAPGRIVVHRHFARHGLAWAPLTRVVSDDDRGLLLWMCSGTPAVREVNSDRQGPRQVPFARWVRQAKQVIEDVWSGPQILKLISPDQAHSVWWFFQPDWTFAGWYVNLEEPSQRWDDGTLAGVDTTDQDLDIRVHPDRRWEWKDVDELTERLAFPEHYWVNDPDVVWAEGRRVVPLIESGRFPFDGTWCGFRVDPSWQWPARVPAGWDRPRVSAR